MVCRVVAVTRRKQRRVRPALSILGGAICLLAATTALQAQTKGAGVLEIRYTPVARAQVAIWIEDASGKFLSTVALTEAVAFRGIGNRPGASQMNSGYRWPYGRREGVLPIWGHRRANAPGAKQFPRVIFQRRIEGYASQTTSDQSKDSYYCLQFDNSKSTRDNLDAVSCATQFNSDKGRYMTQEDVDASYGEPWETRDAAGAVAGEMRAMPLFSVYPARMDVTPCMMSGACFDHADVAKFAEDVREVMPEIDAITRATAPGDSLQKLLYSIPSDWPQGDYVVWVEVNVEGDYNNDTGSGWNNVTYPTPTTPDGWDYYAKSYGYPYRGQPSLAYKVPFSLGAPGEKLTSTDMPVGRSSWDYWAPDYGKLEPVTFSASDARHMSDANGSGADRLRRDSQGHRASVMTKVVDPFPVGPPAGGEPEPEPSGTGTEPPPSSGEETPGTPGAEPSGGEGEDEGRGDDEDEPPSNEPPTSSPGSEPSEEGPGKVIRDSGEGDDGPIGPILDLRLRRHPDELRAHTWVLLRFRAAHSEQSLHEYEVRVATEPITDDASFVRLGRPAKNATDDAEGATALMLPTETPEGDMIDAAIGDLVADTRYFVAVRATDELNRHGPISVAEISTPKRTFATVTPCFVATAAYGTPLAAEIDVLRHLRDRHLSATGPGRAFVAAYHEYGPRAARVIERHEGLRSVVRALLSPLVALARLLP